MPGAYNAPTARQSTTRDRSTIPVLGGTRPRALEDGRLAMMLGPARKRRRIVVSGTVNIVRKPVGMVGEFRAFLTKSNALALAIGVIIGAAMGSVVNGLVNDIIMPPIGYLLGGVDFADLKIVLEPASGIEGAPDYQPEVAILWGAFVNTLITFLVIMLVVFMIARTFIKEEAATPTKACPFCMEENAESATRCRACTSTI
jgi:large conductance mechanosensitive channel